ncbi:hypothetical protein PMIN01_01389 [Paraphaeosphaeria minitans]|uniref:Uncharacterized protein n=1 Tax=Paraphaeosphaeria minitans TaxID=565426 RepID=A0A9P6KWW7_9PLEO|nr:hypothetical protein PMIN01_01389 [Paraphaeosphaeria minitans]
MASATIPSVPSSPASQSSLPWLRVYACSRPQRSTCVVRLCPDQDPGISCTSPFRTAKPPSARRPLALFTNCNTHYAPSGFTRVKPGIDQHRRLG